MYLQITTKCNFHCEHCGFSCTMWGKHGDYWLMRDAMFFILDRDSFLTIGGGEPTLHPRFFDLLRIALNAFDYVWMATNGSQTKSMRRLAAILDGDDSSYLAENSEYECECDDPDNCYCYEKYANDVIYQENKLGVALSQDMFHDRKVDQKIIDLWTKRSTNRGSGYEIRTVNNIIAVGRAKKTGVGWDEDECLCPDMIIRPDGKIKLCGCPTSPIIGDINQGFSSYGENLLELPDYHNRNCWKDVRGQLGRGR